MWCLWCCCIKERAKSFVGDADTQTHRPTQGKIHKTASSQAQIETHRTDKGDKDTGRKKVIIQICLHSIKLHQVEVILNLFFLTGHRALLVAGCITNASKPTHLPQVLISCLSSHVSDLWPVSLFFYPTHPVKKDLHRGAFSDLGTWKLLCSFSVGVYFLRQ